MNYNIIQIIIITTYYYKSVIITIPIINSYILAGIENKHQLDRADVGQDTATAFDLRNLEPVLHLEEDRSPGSVQFTSLVSASFWLVYCPNWMSLDVISLVDHIYKVKVIKLELSKFYETN